MLSLGVGNLLAIAQTNLKRMLAYSTISHVGFILMGFIAGTPQGIQAAMFYTFAYVLMAAAAFGMIILLSRAGFEAERLEDFKGLNARSPWFAFVMLMIMFSMAGVPPFVGFYAKLVVLGSVLDGGSYGSRRSACCSPSSARSTTSGSSGTCTSRSPPIASRSRPRRDMRIALSANGLGLLALGVFPGLLIDLCARVLGG